MDWWDTVTKERFTERTKCIIDQYSTYEVPGTGLHINGLLTQGENIADNGGVKEAYKVEKGFNSASCILNFLFTLYSYSFPAIIFIYCFFPQAYKRYLEKLGHEEKRLPGLEEYSNDQIFFLSYAQVNLYVFFAALQW